LFKKSFVFIKLKCAPDIINYTTDETRAYITLERNYKKIQIMGINPQSKLRGVYIAPLSFARGIIRPASFSDSDL
jgi:hypothetical protein